MAWFAAASGSADAKTVVAHQRFTRPDLEAFLALPAQGPRGDGAVLEQWFRRACESPQLPKPRSLRVRVSAYFPASVGLTNMIICASSSAAIALRYINPTGRINTMVRHFGLATTLAATLALASPAHAVTELQWWHAMTGPNNDVVVKLANDFNASQSDYKIVPTFKGSYADTLNAGIAAFRAGNAPDIMQVFEAGTATMIAAKGAIKPVYRTDEGARRAVRSQILFAGDHRLLLDLEGRDAVVSVQLLEHGAVGQSRRVEEGRYRGSRRRPGRKCSPTPGNCMRPIRPAASPCPGSPGG